MRLWRFYPVSTSSGFLNPKDYNIEHNGRWFFSTLNPIKKVELVNNPGDGGWSLDAVVLKVMRSYIYHRHLRLGKNDRASLEIWLGEIKSKTRKVVFGAVLLEGYKDGDIRGQLRKLVSRTSPDTKGREGLRALDERRKVDTLNWKRIKLMKTIKLGEREQFECSSASDNDYK